MTIEINKYSKIRLLISFVFGLLLVYFLSQIFIAYITYNPNPDIKFSGGIGKSQFQIFKEYFEPLLIVTGMILFSLNRKLSDYISFMIFIFLLAIFPFDFINAGCLDSQYDNGCVNVSIITLLLFGSPLIFLLVNFIRNTGKK